MTRLTLTRYLAPLALPFTLGAVICCLMLVLGYGLGRASAASDIRHYRALVWGFAEHDAHDDATIRRLEDGR